MPTIEEVLKKSGWTDEKIAALDADARGAFGAVLQTAEQESLAAKAEREAAELKARQVKDYFDTEINPALNKWGSEQANLTAERDYWKTKAEKAKEGGFLAADEPFSPPAPARNPAGQFVPGPGGSPVFDPQAFRGEALDVMDQVTHLQGEYFRLYGQPLPDSVKKLAGEAGQQKLSLLDYADRKYNLTAKRAEKQAAQQKERDDKLVQEALAADRKARAEQGGGNPDTARARGSSEFATVTRRVQEGKDGLKDPTTMTAAQRQMQTRSMIHADLAAKENQPQLVH
jgi:hypothetical protein